MRRTAAIRFRLRFRLGLRRLLRMSDPLQDGLDKSILFLDDALALLSETNPDACQRLAANIKSRLQRPGERPGPEMVEDVIQMALDALAREHDRLGLPPIEWPKMGVSR